MSLHRHISEVIWFDADKGYGFAELPDGAGATPPPEGSPDVFIHFKSIAGDGYRYLLAGDRVSFLMRRGPKGFYASAVYVIRSADSAPKHARRCSQVCISASSSHAHA